MPRRGAFYFDKAMDIAAFVEKIGLILRRMSFDFIFKKKLKHYKIQKLGITLSHSDRYIVLYVSDYSKRDGIIEFMNKIENEID